MHLHKSTAIAALALALLLPLGCGREQTPPPAQPDVARDFDDILADGTLRVLFTYNSTGYFIYRGEVMGFEFRLLRAFAKAHDLDLEAVVVRDRSQLVEMLNRGEGDVIAARMTLDEARRDGQLHVLPTQPLYETPPALVQQIQGLQDPQLPEPTEDTIEEATGEELAASEERERQQLDAILDDIHEIRGRLITRPHQLGGETVHLEQGSAYLDRLAELEDRVIGDIHIVELEDAYSAEGAIREVAQGSPMFTVAPNNIAELQEEYYTNVVVMPTLGRANRIIWGVRLNSPDLQVALDTWLDDHREKVEKEYQVYFEEREQFRERVASEYLTTETGQLSAYDDLIREHAADLGWDWRLLASQAFQESRFNPEAESWAGAVGILQIMPATAEEVGVKDLTDPVDNIAGAVRYLDKLDRYWQRYMPELEEPERRKFVLASYNAGFAHVQDARRLAEKHGDDPNAWPDVAYWLLKLSEEEHYTDPVVRFGFVRGLEPVTYVGLILERYAHYLDFVAAHGSEETDEA